MLAGRHPAVGGACRDRLEQSQHMIMGLLTHLQAISSVHLGVVVPQIGADLLIHYKTVGEGLPFWDGALTSIGCAIIPA